MEERSVALSRKERDKLVRSKKKVKNVSHVGFQDGLDLAISSPKNDRGVWNKEASFKDKHVGEILGAFTQAFSFGDLMEDDAESGEEVEALREGLVAMRFSKDFKHQIRSPWTEALIVKVYGRSVGFSFLQNKLLSM